MQLSAMINHLEEHIRSSAGQQLSSKFSFRTSLSDKLVENCARNRALNGYKIVGASLESIRHFLRYFEKKRFQENCCLFSQDAMECHPDLRRSG